MDRWERTKELFHAVLETPTDERSALLDRIGADDRALRSEIESLLASSDDARSFMEVPALEGGAVERLWEAKSEIAGLPGRRQPDGDDALVGAIVDGKYRIEERRGQGGMGSVYRATHLGTERPVALKVIAPELMANPEFVERFRREAKATHRKGFDMKMPLRCDCDKSR